MPPSRRGCKERSTCFDIMYVVVVGPLSGMSSIRSICRKLRGQQRRLVQPTVPLIRYGLQAAAHSDVPNWF